MNKLLFLYAGISLCINSSLNGMDVAIRAKLSEGIVREQIINDLVDATHAAYQDVDDERLREYCNDRSLTLNDLKDELRRVLVIKDAKEKAEESIVSGLQKLMGD